MSGVLEFALVVVALGAALPYVLGPVLVRWRQRESAEPVFEPYDERTGALGADLAAALESSIRALEPEGFHHVADLFHAYRTSETLLRLVLLEYAETGAVAVAVAARGTNPKAPLRFTFVEFAVRFSDERTFSVQNSPQPVVYAPHPAKLTEWLPEVRDPARLWRVFRELLRRRYASFARQRVDVADPAGLMVTALLREYRQQVETGYLWHDRSVDAFRPTWRGAWRMTWKLLPPMSQVRRWRAQRHATRLLRELSLEGPDPRPVPVGVLRDPMRWNFALLIGALVLLWVTRS
ncbi:MAG: hypothetical protein ACREMJ_01515 [Gemmatimonadales bacterium]